MHSQLTENTIQTCIVASCCMDNSDAWRNNYFRAETDLKAFEMQTYRTVLWYLFNEAKQQIWPTFTPRLGLCVFIVVWTVQVHTVSDWWTLCVPVISTSTLQKPLQTLCTFPCSTAELNVRVCVGNGGGGSPLATFPELPFSLWNGVHVHKINLVNMEWSKLGFV